MISYNELLKEYNKLLEENRLLKEELGKFKKSVVYTADIVKKTPISNNPAKFNKHSSPTDKIKLFMKLFCGRTDVFARRW